VSGGGENGGDGGGRIDWPLVISIAALLFGVVQFIREINDNSEYKAVELAERLTVIECKLSMGECRKGN
jgi:hypothetical protein